MEDGRGDGVDGVDDDGCGGIRGLFLLAGCMVNLGQLNVGDWTASTTSSMSGQSTAAPLR